MGLKGQSTLLVLFHSMGRFSSGWKLMWTYSLPYYQGWRGKSRSPFCQPLHQWWFPQRTCGSIKRRERAQSHAVNTELSCFSYEGLFSLANECSLRDILHRPHSPAHLLCPEELQPHSKSKKAEISFRSTILKRWLLVFVNYNSSRRLYKILMCVYVENQVSPCSYFSQLKTLQMCSHVEVIICWFREVHYV